MLTDPINLLTITLILPLLAAGHIVLFRNMPNVRDGGVIVIGLALAGCVLKQFFLGMDEIFASIPMFIMVDDIMFGFSTEPIGLIFMSLAAVLWPVATIYSIGYMRGNNEPYQPRFYICFALAIFAAMGMAASANLFTLFIFYELMTLVTYPLVTHKGNDEAKRAGRVYFGILFTSSIALFLLGIIWVYQIAGTTVFASGGILEGKAENWELGVLFFLFVYGAAKAALMPMHRWLPAAMVAPTPVSALLHAVAVVKAGVFVILKIVIYILGMDTMVEVVDANFFHGKWVVYVAGCTIMLASMIALRQDNLKKMLAYSTISQLSYIIMAAAILAPESLMAGAYHMVAHGFSKITLFFAAGAIYIASRKTKISELDGIGWQMPITMTAFSIGAMSMIGIPLSAGFITKYYLLFSSFERNLTFPLIVLVVSTILNAAYFLPVIWNAFFKGYPQNKPKHGEAPLTMRIALCFTALGTITLFVYPDFIEIMALNVIMDGSDVIPPILESQPIPALEGRLK